MRIIQFTDTHITEANELARGEVNTRSNLIRLLEHLRKWQYDHIILTGDLCLATPSEAIYQWIKEKLCAYLDIEKLSVISGNHDDTVMMARTFGFDKKLQDDELFYKVEMSNHLFYLLDTGKGYASTNQKTWFDSSLKLSKEKRVFVFMHYPPIECGVPHMDNNHSLEDMNDFQEIFLSHPETNFQIFCGHYHNERSVISKNMQVHLTPSCFVQVDSYYEKFVPDHHRIGYRVIDIVEDKLTTFVKYLS